MVWLQPFDQVWCKCEQMLLPITVKNAVYSYLVEQRFYYVGSLTKMILEMNSYDW